MADERRVMIYALGGGMGHAMRGCALARALQAKGVRPRVLLPRDVAWVARALGVEAGRFHAGKNPASQLTAWVEAEVAAFKPDGLVVDVFPRGVLGELRADIAPRRILLTRWVKPAYYAVPEVRAAIDTFDRILCSEPTEGVDGIAVAPVLATHETSPRDLARRLLGVERERLLLVVGSGSQEEQSLTYRRACALSRHLPEGWGIRFASVTLPPDSRAEIPRVHLFPLAPWLSGADAVLTAAGYHAWHELGQAGVPGLFIPLPRQVDDQERRASGALGGGPAWRRVVSSIDDIVESLVEVPGYEPGTARDGASEAADEVVKAL